MRKIVADKIAGQVAEWGHRGLIDETLLAQLQRRYSADVSTGRVLLRWLGFLAMFMLATSVLGFFGLVLGDVAVYLSSPLLAGIAYLLWKYGTKLATDPSQTYATSGAVLVTLSLMFVYGALATTWLLVGGPNNATAIASMMLTTALAALYTAYRCGVRWPLLLGVLLAFHAFGHVHWYGGRGSYFMNIADERATFVAAVAAIVFGLWHEKALERDLDRITVGFGSVYVIVGLLYANMSLWFLTLPRGELALVSLFTVAGIVQLVLGARLHDGRFTGFGIVFLSINFYTRIFEGFWDEASKGALFLISGGLAMVAGYIFEQRARRLREGATS